MRIYRDPYGSKIMYANLEEKWFMLNLAESLSSISVAFPDIMLIVDDSQEVTQECIENFIYERIEVLVKKFIWET